MTTHTKSNKCYITLSLSSVPKVAILERFDFDQIQYTYVHVVIDVGQNYDLGTYFFALKGHGIEFQNAIVSHDMYLQCSGFQFAE